MNPETILPCPNPECGRPCYVNSYEDRDAWEVFVDCCTKDFAGCGYSGPRVDAAQYGLGFAKNKAIRLHNALCRPKAESQPSLVPSQEPAIPIHEIEHVIKWAWNADNHNYVVSRETLEKLVEKYAAPKVKP